MKKGILISTMVLMGVLLMIYFTCNPFYNAKSETSLSDYQVFEQTDSVRASAGASVLYVSTTGVAGNAGDINNPTTIDEAILCIANGGTIWVRGGTYSRTTGVVIALANDGASGSTKKIYAYASEVPVFDFTNQAYADSSRGFTVAGNYWDIKGLTITKAGDNGMIVQGDYNTIQYCIFQANRDAGLQIARYLSATPTADWPKGNLVKNCTSFDNCDPDNGEDFRDFAKALSSLRSAYFTWMMRAVPAQSAPGKLNGNVPEQNAVLESALSPPSAGGPLPSSKPASTKKSAKTQKR
jgi:hypothetical protein